MFADAGESAYSRFASNYSTPGHLKLQLCIIPKLFRLCHIQGGRVTRKASKRCRRVEAVEAQEPPKRFGSRSLYGTSTSGMRSPQQVSNLKRPGQLV